MPHFTFVSLGLLSLLIQVLLDIKAKNKEKKRPLGVHLELEPLLCGAVSQRA